MNKHGEAFVEPVVKADGRRGYVEYFVFADDIKIRHRKYGQVNRLKDDAQRREALEKLRIRIHQQLMEKHQAKKPEKQTKVRLALNELVERKKLYTKQNTWRTYKTAVKMFCDFLGENNPGIKITEITREHINDFLLSRYERKNTSRTRNNYLLALKTLFNMLLDEERIEKNPCAKISVVASRSETHVAYTDAELRKIRTWLNENDRYTFFFCQFIIYTFLRPLEVRFVRIRDIDIENGKLTLPATFSKTRRMLKKIPEDFLKAIRKKKLHKHPQEYFVFSASGKPGAKPVGQNYFEKRFKKLKDKLGFSPLHTMYGLRHSYVSQLARNGAKWHDIMNQTGHTTMTAFSKYMRSLGLQLAPDLSEFISVKF